MALETRMNSFLYPAPIPPKAQPVAKESINDLERQSRRTHQSVPRTAMGEYTGAPPLTSLGMDIFIDVFLKERSWNSSRQPFHRLGLWTTLQNFSRLASSIPSLENRAPKLKKNLILVLDRPRCVSVSISIRAPPNDPYSTIQKKLGRLMNRLPSGPLDTDLNSNSV
jgi:hypothetical protein